MLSSEIEQIQCAQMAELHTTRTSKFSSVTPAMVFGIVGCYFLLQLALRVWRSNSLLVDESEMVLLSQEFRWGYDSQPPLYTWLSQLVFLFTGQGVFGLALLKNILLMAIFTFTYLSAREVFKRNHLALLAAVSLIFIAPVSYDSQLDRTHVVLANLCSVATLFVLLRLMKTGKSVWYVVAGAVMGAGLMSKYSYMIFPIAMMLAFVSFQQTRSLLLDRKMFLLVISFFVVAGPHCIWAWRHPDLLLNQSDKFQIAPQTGFIKAGLAGSLDLLISACSFAWIAFVIYLCVLIGSKRQESLPEDDELPGKVVERALLFGLLVCLVIVLGFHVTRVKIRWLQPVLVSLPLILVFRSQHRLNAPRVRAFFGIASLVAVGLLGFVTLRASNLVTVPGDRLAVSFDKLSEQFRDAGFHGGMILAENRWIGGNLLLNFKDTKVVSGDLPYLDPRENVPILIVWETADNEKFDPIFLKLVEHLSNQPLRIGDAKFVVAARKKGNGAATRLGYLIVPKPKAD